MAAFRQGLKETGYADGVDLQIEERWARNQLDRVPAFADELIRRKVEVIVTVGGTSVAKAVKAIGTTIPIVFVLGSDPVEDGLVASMNRPGGNVTGVTFFSNVLIVKRLEILREIAPKVALIAVLINPRNARAERDTSDMQAGATAVGQRVLFLRAGTPDDLDASFESLSRAGAGPCWSPPMPFSPPSTNNSSGWRRSHAVPAIYGQRQFVTAGGLISYGSSVADSHRQAGVYVGRILKGAKPAELPVMQPVKFDLVINLKTTKALGLTVPPTLLAIADEVIE